MSGFDVIALQASDVTGEGISLSRASVPLLDGMVSVLLPLVVMVEGTVSDVLAVSLPTVSVSRDVGICPL